MHYLVFVWTFKYCLETKIKFSDFCLRVVYDDVDRHLKQDWKEKPNCVIKSARFWKHAPGLFRAPPLCPDNDPGQPHQPEIPLFFWALISLTVGSCNYRIGLPKWSALSGSLCPVLRGLRPEPVDPVAEARKWLGRNSCWRLGRCNFTEQSQTGFTRLFVK